MTLGRLLRGIFLMVLLDLVTRIAAADRAGNRGQGATLAATHLVAQQTASHGTNGRSCNLVRVLHRLVRGYHFVMAHLLRRTRGATHRRHADNAGVLGTIGTTLLCHGAYAAIGIRITIAGRKTKYQESGETDMQRRNDQPVHNALLSGQRRTPHPLESDPSTFIEPLGH